MTYVALLRGINVGGNNKVSMSTLKEILVAAGLKDVSTYINSGNVFFNSTERQATLVKKIEDAIEKEFGFAVKVLLRDLPNITEVVKTLPESWVNDTKMKCDVMFLWDAVDEPKVLEQLPIKTEIDEIKYVPGAILWRVDRENVTKSGMLKIIGTPLYKQMTIRNCNTVRKLLNIMEKMVA